MLTAYLCSFTGRSKSKKRPLADSTTSSRHKMSVISGPGVETGASSMGEKIPSISPNVPAYTSYQSSFSYPATRPSGQVVASTNQQLYDPTATTSHTPQDTMSYNPAASATYIPPATAATYTPPVTTTTYNAESTPVYQPQDQVYSPTVAPYTPTVTAYNPAVTASYVPAASTLPTAYVPAVASGTTAYTPAPSVTPAYTPVASSEGQVYTPVVSTVASPYNPTTQPGAMVYSPSPVSTVSQAYTTPPPALVYTPQVSSQEQPYTPPTPYTPTAPEIGMAYTPPVTTAAVPYSPGVSSVAPVYTPPPAPTYPPVGATATPTYVSEGPSGYTRAPDQYNSGTTTAPPYNPAVPPPVAPSYNSAPVTSYSTTQETEYNPVSAPLHDSTYNTPASPVYTPIATTAPALPSYDRPPASSYDTEASPPYNPTYSSSYSPESPVNTVKPVYSLPYSDPYPDQDDDRDTYEPPQRVYNYDHARKPPTQDVKYGAPTGQEEIIRPPTPVRDENAQNEGPLGLVSVPPAPTSVIPPSVASTNDLFFPQTQRTDPPFASGEPLPANPMQFLTNLISRRIPAGEPSTSVGLLRDLSSLSRITANVDLPDQQVSSSFPSPPQAGRPLARHPSDEGGKRITSTNAFGRSRTDTDRQQEEQPDEEEEEEEEDYLTEEEKKKIEKANQAFGIGQLILQLADEKVQEEPDVEDKEEFTEDQHEMREVDELPAENVANTGEIHVHQFESEQNVTSYIGQQSEVQRESMIVPSKEPLTPRRPVAPWMPSPKPVERRKLKRASQPHPSLSPPPPPPPPPPPQSTGPPLLADNVRMITPVPLAAMLLPPPPPSSEEPPPPPPPTPAPAEPSGQASSALPLEKQLSNHSTSSDSGAEQPIQTITHAPVEAKAVTGHPITVVRQLSNPSPSPPPAAHPIRSIVSAKPFNAHMISNLGQQSFNHREEPRPVPVIGQMPRVRASFPGPPPGPPPPTARQLSGSGIRAPGPPPGPPPVSAKRMQSQEASPLSPPVSEQGRSSEEAPKEADSMPVSQIPSLVSPTTHAPLRNINIAPESSPSFPRATAKPLKSILKRPKPALVSVTPAVDDAGEDWSNESPPTDADLRIPVVGADMTNSGDAPSDTDLRIPVLGSSLHPKSVDMDERIPKPDVRSNPPSLLDMDMRPPMESTMFPPDDEPPPDLQIPVLGGDSGRISQRPPFPGGRPRSPRGRQFSRSPSHDQEHRPVVQMDYGHGQTSETDFDYRREDEMDVDFRESNRLDYGHGRPRGRGGMSIQTVNMERPMHQERFPPHEREFKPNFEHEPMRHFRPRFRPDMRPRGGRGQRFGGHFRPNSPRFSPPYRPRQPFFY